MLILLFISSGTARAQITNGSFETGDYQGWILQETGGVPSSGTWGIASNGQTINFFESTFDFSDGIFVTQFSPGLPHTYSATEGGFVAYQLQNGSELHEMYQDVLVPPVATALLWDMEYLNHLSAFAPGSQELHIALRDPSTNALLATLFRTTQGVSPQFIPMASFCADISPFAGQVVRLSFEHQVQLFFFDAAFDNIRFDAILLPAERLGFAVPPGSTEKQTQTWDEFSLCILDSMGNTVTTSGNVVTVSLAQGTGTLSGTLSKAAVNGVVCFDDISYDSAETILIDVTSPGLTGVFGTQVIVQSFSTDLRVTNEDMTFSPVAPEVNELTTIGARVVNAANEPAVGQVHFYLGDPDFGGTLIGSTPPQDLPVGGEALFSVQWVPATDGLQSIFAIVDNISPGIGEATPEDNRASRQIAVGAAPEELSIVAGQATAWPEAQLLVPITITNIGLGDATITGTSSGPPFWLTLVTPLVGTTLAPGESILAQAQLDVPSNATGGPLNGTPVVQSVPVSIDTATNTFSSDLRVKVFDQPATQVTVRVLDDDTSAPLSGALIAAQDLPGQFQADAAGEAIIQLPPGTRGLFAFKPGYIATAAVFDIPQGSSIQILRLTPGETLAVQEIVSEPLTALEIAERGIDVEDPFNNAVFDFVVAMEFGPPLVLRNVELPSNPAAGTVVQFQGIAHSGTTADSDTNSGVGLGGGGTVISASFTYNDFGRTETWIIIPGQVWVLKQFFEVTTVVINNASAPTPSDVQLQDVQATLALPTGLGLPDLDGIAQTLTQDLGVLNAGQEAQATWIIRGDLGGSYTLDGEVHADLVAFGGTPIPLVANATSPQIEVTVPRIRCEFFTPTTVALGAPFDFGVLVTNEASATAQLVRVLLKEEDLTGCTLNGTAAMQLPGVTLTTDAGGEVLSAEFAVGDIAPGKSGLAEFKLISGVTGVIRRLEIQNGCGGNPSPSVEAVADPPTIVIQPQSQFACLGDDVTFSVSAEGDPPISYQWRSDGSDIAGATGSSLILNGVVVTNVTDYDVVVTNPGGSSTSDLATLTLGETPEITGQPESQALCQGDPGLFAVIATGDPAPTYQWRKDSVDISGATGASYAIASADTLDAGDYDVVITNPCGTVTSLSATLLVHVPPSITGQPAAEQTVCANDSVVFSVVTSGDPAPTFQWRKGGNVITGATGSSYSITSASPADAGSYDVVVTNDCGTVTSSTGALVVNVAPVIDTGPTDALRNEGEAVTFSVAASGTPSPTLQWSRNGVDLDGETGSSLTIDPLSFAHGGTYTVVASNICGTVEASAVLTVNRLPIITCLPAIELWSPKHELIDISGAFNVVDPDGDDLTLTIRCFSDETEVPETGDGTGRHAPDFKNELGGRGLLVRSERRGGEDGRWYVLVITVDDGRGGVLTTACAAAACPHAQNQEAMDEVLAHLAAAQAQIQGALDSSQALPLGGHDEHGLSGQLGPHQ